jgi:hypothetical protein
MVAPDTRRGKGSVADEGHPNQASELLGVGFAIQPPVAVATAEDADVGHCAEDEPGLGEEDEERVCRQERHVRRVAVAGASRYGRKVPRTPDTFGAGHSAGPGDLR